jgi:hypothetical protein
MPISDFTYSSYIYLLNTIAENGYTFVGYHNYTDVVNPCILRHDIDLDVEKSLEMAKIESEKQIQSTYFVLVNTGFYNICSSAVNKTVKEIASIGHDIGLHFDETQYCSPSSRGEKILCKYIRKELNILEQVLEFSITIVSMHRPSNSTLEANITIPGVINSYGQVFFKEFKYISDSRHNWREDVEGIISSKQYKRLHILTHPFWYTEQKTSCRDKLFSFITAGNLARYYALNSNFRDLGEFLELEDIE